MTPETELGAWITGAYQVVSQYNVDDPALDPLEALIKAGRASYLFSATRSLGTIDAHKFNSHRKLSKLKMSAAKEVLRVAESKGFVDVNWANDPNKPVHSFAFKIDSKEKALEAAGAVFSELEPTNVERAILDLLAFTLNIPVPVAMVMNELTSRGYAADDARNALKLATELGLVSQTRETEGRDPIVFNPFAFEKNAAEAFKVLNSLSQTERQSAQDILNNVRTNPGVPFAKGTNKKVLSVLIKVGLVDYSRITTQTTASGVYFATAPYIWGVFGKTDRLQLSTDLIDDSKLLLNSFRYGQFFSQPGRGKIINPYWIVNTLITDGAVGVIKPATAIGQDYPLALSRGIVNIVESRVYPGRFSMELMKKDVAEAVRDVLVQKVILPEQQPPTAEEVERAGNFVSPSAVRVEKGGIDIRTSHS